MVQTNKDVLNKARWEIVRGVAGRGVERLLDDIVLCENCKHWLTTTTNEKDTCGLNAMRMSDPDFFCACGERMSTLERSGEG